MTLWDGSGRSDSVSQLHFFRTLTLTLSQREREQKEK